MAIRFSASGHAVIYSPHRMIMRSVKNPACNDNDSTGNIDAILQAALRLFSEQGISAASHARHHLEDAFFAGDEEGFRWWSAVCRTLDRQINTLCSSESKKVPKPAEI
ncbi:hypothetical protein GRI39_07580 [Altererythrobacter indicus]|uniref:Uncharacterized protein n=1 Tax=Altericroceibacterium indicum TaxID=374177 RepID=A0A845A6B2_9SPHN|nr:hypothetical protein [Altericroceibacterium indicum]MXP25902.1 hypothetical protein [Altericroceibacterium indicum]